MKKISIIIVLSIITLLAGCKDFYKEPHPMKTKTNYDKTMFNLQVPNILSVIEYEIEEQNEEIPMVKSFKYINYNGNDVKLYFVVSLNDDEIELNTFIYNNKNYYMDKNKFPEEIKNEYLKDVEIFMARVKGGSFPNQP